MSDLIEFMRARLDEDEQRALACEHADGPATLEWARGGTRRLRFDNGRSESYASVFTGEWDRILITRDEVGGAPLAKHIARHDPARVLREVAAKRRIVELWAAFDCTLDGLQAPDDHYWRGLYDAMLLIATVYADHPDYRQEWTP